MYEWAFFLVGIVLALLSIIILSKFFYAEPRKENTTGRQEDGQQRHRTKWNCTDMMWCAVAVFLFVLGFLLFVYGFSSTQPAVSGFYSVLGFVNENFRYNGLKIVKAGNETRELEDRKIISYSMHRPAMGHNVTVLRCLDAFYTTHLRYGDCDANEKPVTMTLGCDLIEKQKYQRPAGQEFATNRSLFDVYRYLDTLNVGGNHYSVQTWDCKAHCELLHQFLGCSSTYTF